MKTSNITKSALALALGLCASAALATNKTALSEDFEGDAFDNGVNGVITNNLTWADTEGYTAVTGGKLVVDAADTPTSATIDNTTAGQINGAFGRNAKFNATVSFVPATEAPTVADTNNDLKFALYALASGASTNLCVLAYGGSQTVTALSSVADQDIEIAFTAANTFTVKVGTGSANGPYTFVHTGDISKLEFQGNGDVETLGFSYDLVPFSLQWPAGYTAVSYTIAGGAAQSISGSSPASIDVEDGDAVTFTFRNADGAEKTLSATAAAGSVTSIDASTATFGWADYLGDAVDSAYEIDDLAELILFQKGVAAGLATANTTFKLTADVALATAWPGIGIQDGKDLWSPPSGTSAEDIIIATNTYVNGAFKGTFDGQNHTISGFQMQGGGLDYCGFFNSIYGATICNLKIAYAGALFATDTTASSAESGGTFAGVTGGASTLRNLTTVAGTVSCSKGFGGIVGYLSDGTLVEYCTNNVNLTSMKPNKAGGIAMITQKGSAVTIRNCVNNGTIAGSNETGGLIGYIGNCGAVISNCESTVAYKLFHAQDATPTVAGIIKGSASVAPSYTYANAHTVSGLNFATVDGNVATFVTDGVLAAGNTYKVLGPNATATYEFAAAGSIAFDTALATPTYAVTAPGLVLSDSTSGTVKTYTARAYATVTVTVTGGANATASWTVNDAASAQPTTITEGQSWAVTLTADTGYEFNGSNTTTLSGTAGAADFTIELPNATPVTVTVTVTGGANATAAWTVGESSAQPTTLTYGQAWSVTLTADTGYEFNGSNTTTLSGTAGTTDFTIALPDATAIPPAEYGTGEGKDPAIDIKSGEGSTSHTLTTTEATYLNELVTAKGGTAAAQADIEAAVAQLTEKEFTDAVLLNQDVTDTRTAGSYEFKVSKISKNSSGVTVTVTLTRDGTPRGGIKGQLVLQTSETPNGTYADAAEQTISESSFGTDASPASAKFTFTGSYKFFKVVIR